MPDAQPKPTIEEWFDRWLAEHDAQVAARALRDAAERIYWDSEPGQRPADWLRARADRIEAGDPTP